jgi:hypothetical protein
VVIPKKNGKPKIYVDFKKLNATIKKDIFPWPFTYKVLNTMARCEEYIHLCMDILGILKYIHSSKRQI